MPGTRAQAKLLLFSCFYFPAAFCYVKSGLGIHYLFFVQIAPFLRAKEQAKEWGAKRQKSEFP